MTCPTGGTFNSTSSFPTLLKNNENYTLNVSNCGASSSNGVTFTLTATANDSFNNTGTGSLSLSTTSPSSGGGPGEGGGGGGVVCNCTAWVDKACGVGSANLTCGAGQRLQTRTCTPSACSKEAQCVADTACLAKPGFGFNLSAEALSVVAGEGGKVLVRLNNTGELALNVDASWEQKTGFALLVLTDLFRSLADLLFES